MVWLRSTNIQQAAGLSFGEKPYQGGQREAQGRERAFFNDLHRNFPLDCRARLRHIE
jgi:hypothetical protein